MYSIYRVVIYYRFFGFLIKLKQSEKMMLGKGCAEMAKILGWPASANPMYYKEAFLTQTFLLSGSKKYKFGKRLRMIVS